MFDFCLVPILRTLLCLFLKRLAQIYFLILRVYFIWVVKTRLQTKQIQWVYRQFWHHVAINGSTINIHYVCAFYDADNCLFVTCEGSCFEDPGVFLS